MCDEAVKELPYEEEGEGDDVIWKYCTEKHIKNLKQGIYQDK